MPEKGKKGVEKSEYSSYDVSIASVKPGSCNSGAAEVDGLLDSLQRGER